MRVSVDLACIQYMLLDASWTRARIQMIIAFAEANVYENEVQWAISLPFDFM